jgi:hypothetical protein
LASEICELRDGRRVRFSLGKRHNRPAYFVRFRSPDGRRPEVSTKESNRKRAQHAAIAIIRDTYAPPPTPPPEPDSVEWDDALTLAIRHMRANNLRMTTIRQYELAVKTLRKVVPDSKGPDDITPALAEHFKLVRLEKGRKPRTVENDINNLSIVFGHWFRDTLKIIDCNPFADVEPPRYDKAPPRYIAEDEEQALFKWLTKRWGWRLPVLFLEIKRAIGCRIGELSAALSVNLRDGRLYFPADATKGREERACLLPPALFDELRAIAGPTYVFERFSAELREVHRRKKNHQPANAVRAFTPARLKRWMQHEARNYFDMTKARKFKLHNFRGTAMSKARLAGVSTDDAAIAFDCTVATMQQHYLAFDKTRVADEVFSRIQNGGAGRTQQSGDSAEEELGPGQCGHVRRAQQDDKGTERAQQDGQNG